MKTSTYSVLPIALLVGAVALTSCIMEIDSTKDPQSEGVGFTAGIEGEADSETRTTGGNKWVAGDAVGIYMVSQLGDIGTYVYPDMHNKRYNVVNADTGELKPDASTYPVIAFPDANTEVHFVAYYPYARTGDNVNAYASYSVSLTDQSDPAKIDVMRATTDKVKKGPVKFNFHHSLSKITVNIKLADGVTNITDEQVAAIEDVKLMATPGSAIVSLSKGHVNAGPKADIPMKKEATPAQGYLATFTAIVAPGNDLEGHLKIMFNDRPVLWLVSGKKFLQGKNHIYWGEITDSDFRVEESRITTWTENDKGQVKEVVPAKIQHNYRITWDKTNGRYALTNDPTDAGLFFKFGSVVGVYSAHGKVQTLPVENDQVNLDAFEAANDVAWDPTGNVTGDANAGWATIPCYTSEDFANSLLVAPTIYHNIDRIKAGKGDPCRLVGLDLSKIKNADAATIITVADIDNGKWRLQTMQEDMAFTGREPNGPFTLHWTELNGVKGGMFPTKDAGDATTFLPAAGYRHSETGKVYGQSTYAYYCRFSPYNDKAGNLNFGLTYVSPKNNTVYGHGFSVRCVRQ